jgi:hypothetical protein
MKLSRLPLARTRSPVRLAMIGIKCGDNVSEFLESADLLGKTSLIFQDMKLQERVIGRPVVFGLKRSKKGERKLVTKLGTMQHKKP